MDQYLTPEDYEIAKQNGISYHRLYQRYYVDGWSRERAVNTPIKKSQSLWTKYKDVAVVDNATFYYRMEKGMTPEEAATTPPLPKGKQFKVKTFISQDILDLAEQNGIKKGTLYHRIRTYKWSPEEAATIPVGTKRRKK